MTRYVEPERDVELQGHYAGMVSRFGAYLVDVLVSGVLFGVFAWLVQTALEVVTGNRWTTGEHGLFVAVLYSAWLFVYFSVPLGASGRTTGKALLGLQVVRTDGGDLSFGRAALRTILFPLSFVLFGLGFLWGLVQRDRRCLHDLLAGTVVVYSWDARTARLRLLAREART